MLTGLSSVSSGDAEIFGRSVSGAGMEELHSTMGVCPQHDIHWEQLTGREHLELFARIKGFAGRVEDEANARLNQVKLQSASDSRVGGYSGGMKRRLSIAIALLGDPSIVFLDEPTTGMDPVTRRDVLEMISQSKREDRVIVLTSHAMEEVEMLADKVVVMSRGSVQAIGTVLRLKKRFGQGYKMTMFGTTKDSLSQYLESSNASQVLGSYQVESNIKDGVVVLQFPRVEAAQLVPFFSRFESDKDKLGVGDYSLSLSTLEEVFLNLSKSEEEREQEKFFRSPEYKRRYEECAKYNPIRDKKKTHVGFYNQANALFWKSWTFQLKNCYLCLTVIFFPALVMILFNVLDKVVFDPLRLQFVCGTNVTAAECALDGPNLTCEGLYYTFEPIKTPNNITVGDIDFDSFRGVAINDNCNSVACYYDLEKPDSRNYPIGYSVNASNPGEISYSYGTMMNASELFIWYANLLFMIDYGTSVCELVYNNAFDTTNCNGATSCVNEVRGLTSAAQYWEAQQEQTNLGVGLGACTLTNGVQVAPPLEYTNLYFELYNNLTTCESNVRSQQILPHFANYPIADAIADITPASSTNGFLSYFSLQLTLNEDLNTLTTVIVDAVNQLGDSSSSTFDEYKAIWLNSIGVDPADYQFVPTVDQLCTANITVNVTVSGVLIPTSLNPFQEALFKIAGENATTLKNICSFFGNLDKVRGLSTQSFGLNRQALNNEVYDSWYGIEVSTPLMLAEATNPDLLYKQRQYYSKFGALYVNSLNDSYFDFVLYTNDTADHGSVTTNWIPLYQVTASAFVRQQIGREVFLRTQEMPLQFVCNRAEWLANPDSVTLVCDLLPAFLQISLLDYVALKLFPFLFTLFMFLVVNQIVYEKELKLRIIMRMNGGLKNSVYWIVAFVFFYVQFLIMSLFIYLLGNNAKLQFTSLPDPGVFWGFIGLWGALVVVFGFFLSIFFSSSQSSIAGVFLYILVTNLVGIQLIQNLVEDPNSTNASYAALMWVPSFVMIRVVTWIGLAGVYGQKIHANALLTFADGAIGYSFIIMFGEIVACSILVWYLDNVYVAGFGTRKGIFFFLDFNYWTGNHHAHPPLKEIKNDPKVELTTTMNEDVVAEYERVVDDSSPNMTVRIVRLHKKFANDYVAVKSLSLGINENECFGLLGHNGAGKTTAISMLVGLFEPTSGTALLDGLSIREDLDAVQTRMGVCPQHDVCWGPLSIRDHLLFYARLKGVPRSELSLAVDKALFDVNLKQFENRPSSKLSGGMRRRLSTAMSLIGTPQVVYLDEPSTGLDPASKRALWKVIAQAKGNKSLVLTTHSMEEAEALCDRIGIMALGEMQCIGTAAQLKQRFGTGYTFSISTKPRLTTEAAVVDFVSFLFGAGNVTMLGKGGVSGTYKFEVLRASVVLSKVFEQMESQSTKDTIGVLDWSLTETTLEEVFLKLADMAGVDEALSKKAT